MLEVYREKIYEIKGIKYLCTHTQRENVRREGGRDRKRQREWHTLREMETEVRKATYSPSA